jgi:hypothetical protein
MIDLDKKARFRRLSRFGTIDMRVELQNEKDAQIANGTATCLY